MKVVYKGKTKNGKEILVRYPETEDLVSLLKFINDLSDEGTYIRYQGEHETIESERRYLKGRLEAIKNKKAVHLLVFCNDELAGASEIQMMDKTEKHLGILGVSIAKNFRGEGIGKIMMELIEEEAKKELSDLKIITLEVYSTNDLARDLYKKMGYTDYGILPNGVMRKGKFEDRIFMYKPVVIPSAAQ